MSTQRAPGRALRPGIVLASAVAALLAFAAFTPTASAQVFGPRTDLNTGAAPRNVALGDVNGDGHLDIVVTVQGAGLVSIFRGNGDLTFQPRIDVPVHEQPIALALVDWTGDGKLDLLVGAAGDSTLTVHVGDGAAGFVAAASVDCPTIPYEIEVADVTGDGILDAVIAADEVNVALFDVPGTAGGGLGAPRTWITSTGDRSRSIEIAQLDGQFGPDLYFSSTQGPSQILFSDGAGGFLAPVAVAGSGRSTGVALGDVDGDGKPDAVEVGIPGPSVLRMLRGLGGGLFAATESVLVGSGPLAPALADVNLDGTVDAAFVTSVGSQVSVSLRTCSFDPPQSANVDFDPFDLALGDLDHDGDVDFVVAGLSGASVSIRRNDRGGPGLCGANALLNPSALDFGTQAVGVISTRAIRVGNVGNQPLVWLGAAVATDAFSLPVLPGTALPVGAFVDLSLDALRPALGAVLDTLELTIAGIPPQVLRVPLRAVAREPYPPTLALDPSQFDFPTAPAGTPTDQVLVVSNSGDFPLVFSAPQLATTEFVVLDAYPLVVAARASYSLGLRFLRTADGTILDTLRVTTNDPVMPALAIPVIGNSATQPPYPDLPAPSLAFPVGALNVTEIRTIAVRNLGEAPLVLSAPQVGTAQFVALGTYPVVVAAGVTVDLSVRYLRSALGTHVDTLRLATNAPGAPQLAIPLFGTTVDPLLLAVPSVLPTMLNFNSGPAGAINDLTIQLMNLGQSAYTVTGWSSTNPAFSVSSVVPVVVPAGATRYASVRHVRPLAGVSSGWITLQTNVPTGDSSHVLLQVVVTGTSTGSPAYPSLDVAAIDFGPDALGSATERTVRITAAGGAALQVTGLTVTDPEVTVLTATPFTIFAGAYRDVALRYTRSQLGLLADSLVIASLSTPFPIKRLPLTGEAKRPPIATVDPGAIPLVELPFGATASRTVTLQNAGDEWPLVVTATAVYDSSTQEGEGAAPDGFASLAIAGGGGSQTVALPQMRLDPELHAWDVLGDGSIGVGDPGGFAGGLDWTGFPSQTSAVLEDGGRTIRLGPVASGNFELTRKVHVSADEPWIRYVDIVRNLAGTATYRLAILSTMDVPLAHGAATSSGDGSVQLMDDWIVVEDDAAPAIAHVFAGPGGALRPILASLTSGMRIVRYEYEFTLAAGASAAIMHFALQAPTRALAIERAEALRSPHGPALVGLGAQDRARLLNFGTSPPFSVPIPGVSIPPLSSGPLGVSYDSEVSLGSETLHGSLRIATNDPAQPLIVVPLAMRVLGSAPVIDVAPPGVTVPLVLAARFVPNPAVGRGLRLTYTLPAAGEARFELYDVRGRRIASRVLPAAAAGPGTLDWSGESGGVALATGVYWTRLTHGGRSVVTKGVVLR